ncbi:MAG TPA: DUF2249 domain-containing protein [Actinobacteria bacterium]|nr:DUF2249 domain-containing protein [Actinomycetota bacterium]
MPAPEILLDVSDLEPCEPLERSLAAAAELPEGRYLRILHRREPFPLYDLLDAGGFRHATRPGTITPYEVFVWRAADDAAAAAVAAVLGS